MQVLSKDEVLCRAPPGILMGVLVSDSSKGSSSRARGAYERTVLWDQAAQSSNEGTHCSASAVHVVANGML